jgi:hypothetical protein
MYAGVKGVQPGNYVLNASLNNAGPKEIMVYRDLPTNISHEEFLDLARKFGIAGEIRQGEAGMGMGNRVDYVMVSNYSGRIEYTHHTNFHPSAENQPKLPSDDEAIQIAMNYLNERDLMPVGTLLPDIYYGQVTTMFPNGTDVTWNEAVFVQFRRGALNGTPFVGADRAQVEIGNNGEVLSYWSLGRSYEPTKMYPIKTPSEAFEELKMQGIFNGLKIDIVPDTAVINNVYLVYHSKAAAEKEYYLDPEYVFEGTCYGHEGNESRVEPITEYIPALWEEPAEFINSS